MRRRRLYELGFQQGLDCRKHEHVYSRCNFLFRAINVWVFTKASLYTTSLPRRLSGCSRTRAVSSTLVPDYLRRDTGDAVLVDVFTSSTATTSHRHDHRRRWAQKPIRPAVVSDRHIGQRMGRDGPRCAAARPAPLIETGGPRMQSCSLPQRFLVARAPHFPAGRKSLLVLRPMVATDDWRSDPAVAAASTMRAARRSTPNPASR